VTRSVWPTIPFWLGYLLPPIIIVSVFNRGWYAWAPIVIIFVVLPLFDWLSGVAAIPREAPDLAFNNWFRVVTWLWVPVQLALIGWLIATVPRDFLSTAEFVGATVSVGATSGAIGITFAHELIHRRHAYERAFGTILLLSVTYPHFAIEHVKGHHRHVGTPRDPATARLGESVYRFLPRSILGGWISAWHIERRRLWEHEISTWSWRNLMLRYVAAEIVIYASIGFAFGGLALAMFAGQSLVAIVILEIINYIEHYGLERAETAPGRYAPPPWMDDVKIPAFGIWHPRPVTVSTAHGVEKRFWFEVDPALLAVARRSAEVALERCDAAGRCLGHAPHVVVGGNGVSGQAFVDNAAFREYAFRTFQANVLDMETAATAQVAYANGVPFIAFRSLSDLAGGGEGANEMETFLRIAADNSARVLLAFLEAWK